MKKTLLFSVLMAGAMTALSQGSLDWGNNFTGTARNPIYGADPGNPGTSLSGQSSLGVPSGTTTYNGALLQGAGFTFAVYGGAAGITDPNALSLLVSTTFRTATGNALPAGLVIGGTVTVPGVAAGSVATFQIRAWDNTGGATWATATTRGASALIQSGPLGGIGPSGPVLNPQTTGWQSFSLAQAVVPEPSTFALAGLGAAALLIFRRRK